MNKNPIAFIIDNQLIKQDGPIFLGSISETIFRRPDSRNNQKKQKQIILNQQNCRKTP